MVDQGLILGHVVLKIVLEVDKGKINIIKSLPYPMSVTKVHFFAHERFYRRFIKHFSNTTVHMCQLFQKDVEFEFTEDCKKAFDLLKNLLTATPIIRPLYWIFPFGYV